jgi:hypothetical protein
MATQYSLSGGTYSAVNLFAAEGLLFAEDIHISVLAPAEATVSVVDEITLPSDAEVDAAVVAVTARAPGFTAVASVADVRSSTPVLSTATSAMVIDFGRIVAVAGVSSSFAHTTTARWTGSAFSHIGGGSPTTFPEQSTDRLLAQFTSSVSEAAFRTDGTVYLPATPTGLELLVDGVTAWFERQGSGAGLTEPSAGDGVGYAVDLTGPLRAAFAQRPGGPVKVELRTATPGLLSLTPTVGYHRVHPVAFPDGASKALSLAAEGPFTLELPLPAVSSGWQVEQVTVTVAGGAGEDRVQPADGPPTAVADARLTLTPGRVLLARVPDVLLDRFTMLTGIRLPLLAAGSGGEISGRLLADAGGRPGEPLDGGALAGVRIEPSATPVWTTLPLPGPLALEGTPLWLEVQVAYGAVEWALSANAAHDPVAPGAVLHRRLPGGGVQAFPQLAELGPLHGAVRLVGRPDVHRPIAVVALDLATGAPAEVSPSGGDVAVTIGVPAPVTPVDATLVVDGIATAAVELVFSDVRVRYREPAAG